MYDVKYFSPDYVWHLKPEFKFPWMPISVRSRLMEIDKASIKNSFKIEWVTAIASLFDEYHMYAKESLDSKITNAEKKLNTVLTFADEKDIGNDGIDADWINKEILKTFEEHLKKEN